MRTMTAVPEASLPLNAAFQKAAAALQMPEPAEPAWQIMQRLMAFRNERRLHRRRCDFTKQPILSAYPEDKPFPVYRNDIWWGDAWDARQYGRPFDFSRTFFEQFADLQRVVPREGTSVFNCENCDYNGHIRFSKNCYMNSLVHSCEDTHYSYWMVNDKDVVDCYLVNNSTLAYDCVDCDSLYHCVGLQECMNCSDCHFSYQLRGCENCIGCCDLVRKQYHVANRPVPKEQFDALAAALLNGTREGLQKGRRMFEEARTASKQRAVHNLNCEGSIGDHLSGCKTCLMCFDVQNGEDCLCSISAADSKDIYYCYSAGWPACELVYQSAVTRGSRNVAFCYYTFMSHDLRYCDSSMSSHNCFGCIGMKRQEYCVLNRQYSREEYFNLERRIIRHMQDTGEWGRFFPPELSTFEYNESAAQDFFPLEKEEAERAGWKWREAEPPASGPVLHAPPVLPPSADDALQQIFSCTATGARYKIVRQEFEFYRRMGLPIPALCSEARFRERRLRRNPYQLVERTCAATGKPVWSTLPLERAATVYSDDAYLAEVE